MTVILQISDPHVLADGHVLEGRIDTAARFAEALQLVKNSPRTPDLVILSGDLVNNGSEAEYRNLASILERSGVDALPVMGNHDDRERLRQFLPTPARSGSGTEPFQYVVEIPDGRRIIVLDTTEPGLHSGVLDTLRLEWLEDRLNEHPNAPTIVVQHHPPFASGIGFMDQYGLDGAIAEAEILNRHPQVCAVLCGHLHRPAVSTVGGIMTFTAPSCAAQVALDLVGGGTAYTGEPGMVAWHLWTGQSVVSHTSPTVDLGSWVPAWALEERT